MSGFIRSFPDMRGKLEEVRADSLGDEQSVLLLYTFRGTFNGDKPFQNIQPNGKAFEADATFTLKFDSLGKMQHVDKTYDRSVVMAQLLNENEDSVVLNMSTGGETSTNSIASRREAFFPSASLTTEAVVHSRLAIVRKTLKEVLIDRNVLLTCLQLVSKSLAVHVIYFLPN